MTAGLDFWTATRYRLDVVGLRLAEVVEHAGGWLFDHVMAGWDVTSLLPECSDPRPLHILGVQVAIVDGASWETRTRAASTIAVCETSYRDEAALRRYLDQAVQHGSEVVLWSRDPGVHSVPAVGQIPHRLTRAARVFKAEALRALNDQRGADADGVGGLEWFRCLTCNTPAASEPEAARHLPRRAFNCVPQFPGSVECDRWLERPEDTVDVTPAAERRVL